MRDIAGCLPVMRRDGVIKILLINSRNHAGRLVFPKGGVKKSETAGEAALRETWEEAGVTGRLEQEFEGFFVLQVEEVADEWPEKGERQRYWFGLDEALRLGNVTEEVHRLIVKVVDYIRLHEKPGGGCIMM